MCSTIVPVLVTLPLAIAITSQWSAVLSGCIVQVTVISYSGLATNVEMSVIAVSFVTEEGTNQWKKQLCKYHVSRYAHVPI